MIKTKAKGSYSRTAEGWH